MRFLSFICLVFSSLITPAWGQNIGPDIIFHNATVLTMEESQPEAQALALKGDSILAIGNNQDILNLQDMETQVIDLEGKTLMPGFVDAHTHLFNQAEGLGLSLEDAQRLALENGVTTLANLFATADFLEQMQNFEQELRVRTSLYLVYNTNCGDIVGDWYKGHPPTRQRGEMLRIGGVKIFTDGGIMKNDIRPYVFPPRGGKT